MSAAAPATERLAHLSVLSGLLLLALLGCNRGLWTPDEPREAEISREMALSPGVIPTLNGQRFIEKPPLYYWVVAAAFRVSGGASVLAARAVSVLAGVATLLLLLHWGSAAQGRSAGLISACMLATSLQFMVSTHWVLIDPLLMLSTTVAAWAAWELLWRRDDGAAPRRLRYLESLLYLALVLALWIKGLVGPALIGAGLLAYVLVDRPPTWRRLRPLPGVALLAAAVALLALAIFSQGGAAAVWEWAYVNHVQRLINPLGSSGHRQPLLYYAWTLPYALLPWLLPLIEALRPASWQRAAPPPLTQRPDPARFGALMGAGMLLLLSLSASKRETYLLPVLPLLFLWLGIRSDQWWQRWQLAAGTAPGLGWWLQVVLLCLYCLLPPLAAWVFLGSAAAPIIIALLLALVPVVALLHASAGGEPRRARTWMLIAAFTANGLILALAGPLLNDTKDMGPFVQAVGERLPPGQPVYTVNMDETLAAEIPFYTGRRAVSADRASPPQWLLVQDNHQGKLPSLTPDYLLIAQRSFGPRRSLMLWQARERASSSQADSR
jgi:4-amino-4-deoxy-L-arabinose transferase-like glycosyltransferase